MSVETLLNTYLSKTVNPAGWTTIGYTGSTE
jgi:hypothetical protein